MMENRLLTTKLKCRVMTVAVVVVWIVVFVPLGAAALYCKQQSPGGRLPRIEQLGNGVVVFEAAIDDQTATRLVDLLEHSRLPITKLVLNSGGGFADAAARIAAAIGQIPHIKAWVPAKAVCQSACIQILSVWPGDMEVDPAAQLMFHAAAGRSSLSDCWICRQLNDMTVWLSMHAPGHDNQAMRPWAAALSTELPKLFDMCPVNPLETQKGITITGTDLSNLRAGSIKPEKLLSHCPTKD